MPLALARIYSSSAHTTARTSRAVPGQRVKRDLEVPLEADPHVPLPRWVGRSQHAGHDVDPVIRHESGVVTHESGVATGSLRHRRSWSLVPAPP